MMYRGKFNHITGFWRVQKKGLFFWHDIRSQVFSSKEAAQSRVNFYARGHEESSIILVPDDSELLPQDMSLDPPPPYPPPTHTLGGMIQNHQPCAQAGLGGSSGQSQAAGNSR